MKTYQLQDLHGIEITLSHSSLATQAAYRIYLSGEGIIEEEDKMGNKIPVCIHLNTNQAEVIINALKDLIADNEE